MKIPQSHFKPLTADLIETVRNWRNKPRISSNMLTSQYISQADQQKWFADLVTRRDKRYLAFHQNTRPVGILNFDRIGTDQPSWGCYLGEEDVWPGSGLLLEIAALDHAFDILQQDILYAEVLAHNESPIRMHLFFGYQEKDTQEIIRDGQPLALRTFAYTKDDWQKSRPQVLARLPGNIRLASELITFEQS